MLRRITAAHKREHESDAADHSADVKFEIGHLFSPRTRDWRSIQMNANLITPGSNQD
jgi:hypothetical protein